MTDPQSRLIRNGRHGTVIAIANQKGGSGKTTTAIHLSVALAELGKRVLLVDLDPQGHVADGFGIPSHSLEHEMSDVLTGERPFSDILIRGVRPGLDLAPSNIRLSDMELTLVNMRFRELKLRRAIEPVLGSYDFILLDCPPNLGLLTVNGLIAANQVLIPMTSEYLSMLGVSLLLKTITAIQAEGNPDLRILGILHTRFKRHTVHAREVVERTEIELGDQIRIFGDTVNESTRFPEASGQGRPVFEVDPEIPGAIAYRQVAKEIAYGTSN